VQLPVQVSFRGLPVSDEIEAACVREAEKLERYAKRISACRVVISAPHKHRTRGNLFEVRIDLTIPGHEIVVNRVPPDHASDEKLELALREAFDTVRRRVEDAVRKQSGAVKAHEPTAHGRISRLDPAAEFGFIETADRRDLYFHRNSVLNEGYDSLAVGDQVRFVEEVGQDGPHATSVSAVGRHHHLSP